MFLYLTVVDGNRRASGRAGTVLYDVAALTVMGFGGGIINPILLSYDSFFRSMEAMPCSRSSSPRTRSWGSGAARLDVAGVRHVRLVAFELVRAKLIHGWCAKSAQIISASGIRNARVRRAHRRRHWQLRRLFLINGGISPIKESVPWPVESAILASAVPFLWPTRLS